MQKTIVRLVPEKDGSLTEQREIVASKEHVHDLVPIYDTKGKGIAAASVPLFTETVIPEKVEKRIHPIAHQFFKMLQDGFDPRDPKKYIAKLKSEEALPGMPTRTEWAQRGHNSISQSELFMRKWLAMEMLALVVMNHEDRITNLEGSK